MVAVRLRQLVTAGTLGYGGYTGRSEKELHITREGFRNGDKGMGGGRVKIRSLGLCKPRQRSFPPVQHEGGALLDDYTARTADCRARQFEALTQFQYRFLADSHNHVSILPIHCQCHVFAQRNPAVDNTYRRFYILLDQIDIGEFDINGIGVGSALPRKWKLSLSSPSQVRVWPPPSILK